ncbi:hypothetical protein PPACK8108_LOCUS3220 [Phakopsora pachyrhizi]|uniref:Uncharacterized protein n=1 Tax=Phakopsora pachyrhizi TaxID=170000 RepID=A0AAV0AKS6_PHAPC|nr:hypothetical protein PPACK8108_LOCUS3220 [Phakopsora pachyrhizi]
MINYESNKSQQQQQQQTKTTSIRDSILPRQSELLNRTLRSQTQQQQQLNFKQQQQPDQRFIYTVIIRNRVFKLTYNQICFKTKPIHLLIPRIFSQVNIKVTQHPPLINLQL